MISLIKDSLKPAYHFFKSKNRREFYRLLDRYGSTERFKNRLVEFLHYRFLVPDCQSFIWQFKEIFDDEIYKFLTNIENPVIFDCGANIGLSVLYFKHRFPMSRIKAFEADPEIARILKTNLTSNRIENVEIIDKAVWINDKGVELGIQGADAASLYLGTNRQTVASIRLADTLCQEEAVHMLKIDIEGAEVDVLIDCAGCLSRVKNLFVEYHSITRDEQRLDKLLNILTTSGFRYYIQSISSRKQPFIHKKIDHHIDLKLNIFAFR
jgi:FkbM family methyltransferase